MATGTKAVRTLLTPIGALVFGLFTALFVYLATLVDRALSLPWPFSDAVGWFVAVPLMAVGGAAIAWSAFHFVRAKGTPVPFNPPPTLVESGPYRYVRNPMVSGVFLLLFGIGFAIRSLSLVVIFTPLYILANVWELKKIEEPELIRRLGEDYLAYRERTPMLFPRIRGRN
ncbi:MAG: isoprenylcysteine carboxylmethyltransferase family protein [Anaerolineales bacterium]